MTRKEDRILKKQFRKNSKDYKDNFERMVNFYELLEFAKNPKQRSQLKKAHKECAWKERKLNREDIRLRLALGIYIHEPCPGISCAFAKCGSRKCKRLKKKKEEKNNG